MNKTGQYNHNIMPWYVLFSGCLKFSDPINGFVDYSGSTKLEERAKFSCKKGYTLIGSEEIACKCGLSWNGDPPTCTMCSAASVNNAIPSTTALETGQTVTYTCPAGYEQTGGDLKRTCLKDGILDGADPVCTSKWF